MNFIRKLLFFLFLLPFIQFFAHAQSTVYGGEGWGAETDGGKGGEIIRVTNLNASGTGSFSAAVKATGKRIVVFEVGGVINLHGTTITIENPFVTIAGQTAPSPGITFINGSVYIRTHDVILQHIIMRPGSEGHETGWEPDGLSTVGAHRVIIDHCSFSWAVDENCSVSGDRFNGDTPDEWRANTSHDVTISNNIIAEALSHATHDKGQHSMGSLIHDNATNIAVIKNLYASNNARNPLFKGGTMGVVVNNYIYNPGNSAIRYSVVYSEWSGHDVITGKMAVVGNVMEQGPDTDDIPLMRATNSPCQLYLSDNIATGRNGNPVAEYVGDPEYLVSSLPIWHNSIEVLDPADVKNHVLNSSGARPWDRDAIDARIVSEVTNKTSRIIDRETEVGGLPHYEQTNAPFNANEWNMNCMVRILPDFSPFIPQYDDAFYKDSTLTVTATYPGMSGIRFIELFVNNKRQGKLETPPFSWEFTADSTGEYTIKMIMAKTDGEFLASESKTITVVENQQSTDGAIEFAASKKPSIKIFPNPFTGRTTLTLNLKKKCKSLEISIYNSYGRKVETLFNGEKEAGDHRFVWEPQNMAGGICFVLTETDDGKFVDKMVLH
ncbi:MAG: hypothetical protein K9H26_11380 [Prolixibacteraceae bacterium]|nr:hypothetical protein [Prolixibacteraceae bacterium]